MEACNSNRHKAAQNDTETHISSYEDDNSHRTVEWSREKLTLLRRETQNSNRDMQPLTTTERRTTTTKTS